MDPQAAIAVLHAASVVRKLDASQARVVLSQWLQSSGYELDRWGNYRTPDGHRYHLATKVLQYQAKIGDRWGTIKSWSLIDAAGNTIRNAAKALGREAEFERFMAQLGQRKAQSQKAAHRRATQAQQNEALDVALKITTYENWPTAYRAWVQGDSDAEARMSSLFQGEAFALRDRLIAGGFDPKGEDDARWTDLAHPPLLPLVRAIDQTWVQNIEGVDYTVSVRHHAVGSVEIQIGKSAEVFGLSVDPYSLAARADMKSMKAEGDAYAAAKLRVHPKGVLLATLFMVTAQTKRTGAGRRILRLWCELMRGYQIPAWIAEAVGEEGQGFLRALHEKGEIEILKASGSDMLVQCGQSGGLFVG